MFYLLPVFRINEKNHYDGDNYQVKADMIKWMFIFWVGQISVTVGLILLVIK
ncbi:MAG: hypothetical protein HQ542_11895 [Bacteroidia bacterium]|nr:hypothetical protein [Bacteroidia bacterium]